MLIAIALGVIPAIACAQPERADLAGVLEPIRQEAGLPALAAAVVRGDRVVAIGAVGRRAADAETPVTTDDLWHIGSCTKAMTATLCAKLVEEGVLDWGSTLASVFPDQAPAMHESWRDVTLLQLITNRSGAPAQLDRGGLWRSLWTADGPPTEHRRKLLEGVTSRPTEHQPGSAYLYSNAGFALAGHMAETVTGKPFETLTQERLFAPLGITTAGFGAPGSADAQTPDQPPDQPRGHRGPTPVAPGRSADNPPAIAPAGRVHLSLPDWARFASLHLRGHADNPDRKPEFLSPESFDLLHTPAAEGEPRYAGGWIIAPRAWAGGVALTHGGSNTMWYAVIWIAPARDLAMLVATNTGDPRAPRAIDRVIGELIKLQQEP